jgi:hypothetical protein
LAKPAVNALVFLTSHFTFGLALLRASAAFHDDPRAASGSEFMPAKNPIVRR